MSPSKESRPPRRGPRNSSHPAEVADEPSTIAPPSRASAPPPPAIIPRDDARSVALRPAGLLARALFEPKEPFVAWFEGAPLLLVRLDLEGLLAAGLVETENTPSSTLKPAPDSLSFATTTNVLDVARERSRRPLSKRALADVLRQAPHYLVILRKRTTAGGKPFTHRVSIGRARNNDVVLRHPTVSKFHAWLECNEDGDFFLCDAKSKNETLLNDKPLVPKQLARVTSGDRIRFGSVVAVYSTPDALWDALALTQSSIKR